MVKTESQAEVSRIDAVKNVEKGFLSGNSQAQ